MKRYQHSSKARSFLLKNVCLLVAIMLLVGSVPLTVGAVIYPNNCAVPPFQSPPEGSLTVSATDETALRYLGRALPIDQTAYWSFPLSGVEFNVTDATSVYMKLSTSLEPGAYQPIGYNLMGVWIDDKPEYVLYHLANTKFKKQTYIRIAKFDQPGDHKIRVMKVTCPEVKIHLSELAVSGDGATITPSTPRERQIEFVGDSITVALDLMSAEEQQGRYTEAWQGYAGRTAEYFGADISIAAIGGGFLVDKNQLHNAHRFYYLADPFRSTVAHGGQNNDYLWSFSRFTPSIVVVNLGTNLGWATTYMDYVNFYHKIRQQYADQSTPVLFALGAMWLDDADEQIVQAVDYINNTLGDPNVYGLMLGEGYKGGSGHPSWSEHQLMADVLIAEIERIMPGWGAQQKGE